MERKRWDKKEAKKIDKNLADGMSKEDIVKALQTLYPDRTEKAIRQFVNRRAAAAGEKTNIKSFQTSFEAFYKEIQKLIDTCLDLQIENKNLKADLEKLQGLRKAVEAYSGAGK